MNQVSENRPTDDKLREILAGCEGVTPGPWTQHEKGVHPHSFISGPPVEFEYGEDNMVLAYVTGFDVERNRSHIARLDPATVAAIVSELLALRQQQEPAGWRVPVAYVTEEALRQMRESKGGFTPHIFTTNAQEVDKDGRPLVPLYDRISAAIEPAGDGGLAKVLHALVNEADGLSFREDAIRNIVGNTNWNVLRLRITEARAALASSPLPVAGEAEPVAWPVGASFAVEYDGFSGTVQGHYVTREGKRGIVGQQHGTGIVHVYREDRATLPTRGEKAE